MVAAGRRRRYQAKEAVGVKDEVLSGGTLVPDDCMHPSYLEVAGNDLRSPAIDSWVR